MSLESLYNSWTFKPLGVNTYQGSGTPVLQALGGIAVDFLPNTYQKEVRNRAPGDKIVLQSEEPGIGDAASTKGTFAPKGLLFHKEQTNDVLLTRWRGKDLHKYNVQDTDPNKQYITSADIRNTPGALYLTNP